MIKTTLKISGMVCGMCDAHVNDCIRRNFPIRKIKTSHAKGLAEVLSDLPLEEKKLREVISGTGYTLVSVQSEPSVRKSLFSR